jgi:hypothetical protein
MTKQEFKTKVGMGFFSCKWLKNNNRVGIVKRGILGGYAWRFTNNPVPTNTTEHESYVLAFRVGSGLLPEHRRWVNINPETVFEVNRVRV